MIRNILYHKKTIFNAKFAELKSFAKVLTDILYFIKFTVKIFMIELEQKMLSVSDGRTDGPTVGHFALYKQFRCLIIKTFI